MEGNHFDKSLPGGRRVSRESNWGIRGELINRKTTMLRTRHEQNIKLWANSPSHSNATRSLYSATATNSSPCKKHGGGGVPSIIHLEIDRCVSPETTVWIVCFSASLWALACEFVSIEIRVRVQNDKVSNGATLNPKPRHLTGQKSHFILEISLGFFSPLRCFTLMQQWIECELKSNAIMV